MSESSTWDTLLLARDYRAWGREAEAAAAMAALDAELPAYVRKGPARISLVPVLYDRDEQERLDIVAWNVKQRTTRWLEWRELPRADTYVMADGVMPSIHMVRIEWVER